MKRKRGTLILGIVPCCDVAEGGEGQGSRWQGGRGIVVEYVWRGVEEIGPENGNHEAGHVQTTASDG